MSILLTEFDPSTALIEPSIVNEPVEGFPKTAVAPFSHDLFAIIQKMPGARQISDLGNSNGVTPVFAVPYKGQEIAVYMAPVGSSCSVTAIEEIHVMGAENILTFGSCGVLDKRIEEGGIILPTAAFRDEGASFHYAPPSEEIELDPVGVSVLEQLVHELGLPYHKGKVWTVDSYYRETPAKVARRRDAGAIAVDMECSALTACASFRKFRYASFFYVTDSIDNDAWDARGFTQDGIHIKDQVLSIAFEAALRLERQNN